jgi:thymidylate synthase
MGYNTWLSLPEEHRPLKDRKNIILTRQKREDSDEVIFTTFENFKSFFDAKTKYFVIGGGQIFNLFLKDDVFRPSRIILTSITPEISVDSDTFMNPDLFGYYNITGYSDEMDGISLKYRYIYLSLRSGSHQEQKYLDTIKKILHLGEERTDRTNTGTISCFGESIRFDISNSIPLMTSKKVSFKNIVEELLWFCKGQTDSKILSEKGVNIWKGNSSRKFLDSRGLHDNKEGECGPIYGHQWRRFGQRPGENGTGVDQLKYVEELLNTDPYSRRIVISAWNPYDSDKMALLPCHTSVQWYVTNSTHLNCLFTMRSSDFALASCYNIVSYSILTYILAKRHNMKPGEIIYNAGDCHIYKNHLKAVNEQFKRKFRPFPCLEMSEDIKTKNWEDMDYSDFTLVGYFPNGAIKMDMAV